ncbi:two-component regulator propeller domain-containing protein [Flavobacterium piscis]|uniref:histidine kinase n=1 Tax=Flavobacterium piscis TaxID=1114874 RepID=A0ABU1Y5R0_9FLAO|nr:two-component regulator propeller domain-containing protein [Flavobacterium piscis]MDR7209558.1 signal transduction histidine kinase/DNA-binding response OmpR family regulator/ligand-binding sensor domain-containing protein [Flavobacterium piscis]
MKNRILLFLMLLVYFTAKPQAAGTSIPNYEKEKYDIGYIGIKNGLANNAVTSVYKDKRGLMWFGTYDGISRYDGYNFLNFRNDPNDANSLINNRIVSVCGTQNEIWIGTKGGISIYDYLSNRFNTKYYINAKTSKSEPIDFVINEIRDYKSNMYIATAGSGLLYCAGKQEKIIQIPLYVKGKLRWDYHVEGMDFDRSGKLWCFVSGVGLVTMEASSKKLSVVFSDVMGGGCVLCDKFSNVWVGIEEGLLKYNTINKTHHVYANQKIRYPVSDLMCKPDKKELWIATNGNGIVKYKYASDTFSLLGESLNEEKLNSNAISSLCLDNVNRVWIGTLRGGVNKIEERKSPFTTVSKNEKIKNTLPSDFILSFSEHDSNHLWIGTDGGGASLWNRKNNTFANYSYNSNNPNTLSNNFVSAIVKDKKGTWFATYGGGVNFLNSETHNFKKYNLFNPKLNLIQKNAWVLFRAKNNVLWAASPDEEGLYRYNETNDKFDFVDAKIRGIITIAEDKNGNLWIGNFTKLFQLNPKTMKRKEIYVKYPVRSIVSHSATKMIVGTEGGGLMFFNPQTLKARFLTQNNGLPNNSVLNVVQDNQGAYWCSTYNGIFVYNADSGKITSYYDTDGLQSNQFNYNAALKLSTGEIIFGGIKGFNIIDTEMNSQIHDFPKLIITSIKVNNKVFDHSGLASFGIDKLKLPYDESMLNIDFAALEYSLPEKISYAYFLDGWDSQWHYVDNIRSANYSRLTEGDYVLKIKSTNAEGVWNTKTISLPITILPPWYRSGWAYLSYALFIAFIIYLVDKYQRQQAHLKYEVKLSQDLAKQEKELNEKKLTFFTNISHEFRSPLTMIINPLKDIIYGTDQQIDPGAIEMVYSNSRRLLSLVDQLLLFRKTETETGKLKVGQIDIVELGKEVFSCFVHHAKTKKIDYSFSISEEKLFVYVDREKIEMALFNLISNALKFTEKENGKVVVSLRCSDNEVIINVMDNGEGVLDADKDKIFNLFYQSNNNIKNNRKGFGIGLYLVKQFVTQHHGEVSCRDNENGGAIFEIRLPLGKEHFGDIEIREDLSDRTLFLEEALEDTVIQENILETIETPENGNDLIKDAKSILVVDDNAQIRNYLKRILTPKYHITVAESAEAALGIIKKVQPDLVISDVVMGEMNGVAFCKHIKTDEELKHIPVILLTGGTSEEVKLKGAEVGADDYITKPFDNEYLLARISGIFARRESEQNYMLNSVTKNTASLKLSDEDKKLIDKIVDVIDANLDVENFNVHDLAFHLGMSYSLVYKKIKKITGKSVSEFTRNVRLRKVATLLITTDLQISEAASIAGFGDIKYFRKHFQQFYNLNPSEFRKKYQNVKDNKYILNESFWKST